MFFGAADLDIAPATPGASVDAGRIWCAAGTPISASLSLHLRGGISAANVRFAILGPSGRPLVGGMSQAHGTIADTGWHVLRVITDASAAGSADYELSVTYFGTERL